MKVNLHFELLVTVRRVEIGVFLFSVLAVFLAKYIVKSPVEYNRA